MALVLMLDDARKRRGPARPFVAPEPVPAYTNSHIAEIYIARSCRSVHPNPLDATHSFTYIAKPLDVLGLHRNSNRYIGSAILERNLKSENKKQRFWEGRREGRFRA